MSSPEDVCGLTNHKAVSSGWEETHRYKSNQGKKGRKRRSSGGIHGSAHPPGAQQDLPSTPHHSSHDTSHTRPPTGPIHTSNYTQTTLNSFPQYTLPPIPPQIFSPTPFRGSILHSHTQNTLAGSTTSPVTGVAWGHPQGSPRPHCIRVLSQNIGNLPIKKDDPKSFFFINQVAGYDTGDIRLFQEIGINWSHINPRHNWYARTRLTRSRIAGIFGHNTCDSSVHPRQFGGTAVIASRKIVPRCRDRGLDPAKLGRWAWMRVGDQRFTTLISSYCPCVPFNNRGFNSL